MSNNEEKTPSPVPSKGEKSLSTSHHTSTMSQSGGKGSGQSGGGQSSDNTGSSGSQSGDNMGSGKS